jgi:pimeloyl-ACP methyl ester carboxylesterase
MVSAELGGGLAAANPLVDYRTVAGTGHSPHRDSPDAALAVLREWLAATA